MSYEPYEPRCTDDQAETQWERIERFGAVRPADVPDPRPLPDDDFARTALDTVFQSLYELFEDTCLEEQVPDLLWGLVNVVHRKIDRLNRGFDQIAADIRRAIPAQDGTEIRSQELEVLEIRGKATSAAVEWFETFRASAIQQFEAATGNAWQPSHGSVPSTALTAAVVDAKDLLAAQERKRYSQLVPEGAKVIITGGTDYQNVEAVFAALGAVHKRHPDMVLVHGGATKGCDHIAAQWANSYKVPQVVFKPDWKKYGAKRAGFERNDQMLHVKPIGVLHFPGSGVNDNLADKARKLGIKVKSFK